MPGHCSTLIVALSADLDDHFSLRCRLHERIFDKIAQRVGSCRGVASDQDRVIGADQRDRSAG